MIDNLFTDFFGAVRPTDNAKRMRPFYAGSHGSTGCPLPLLGHRKGTTLEENLRCNFGMPGPEGYRKALRVMKQAEKISPSHHHILLILPVLTPARMRKNAAKGKPLPAT